MKILVINGSPKGDESITLQTLKYLEILNPKHEFKYLNVGQKIRVYEKNFKEPVELISWSDLIIFSYPVYIFLAPYQLQRFIELIDIHKLDISDKMVSQFTTSKHFYDVTAHEFIRLNCLDRGMKYFTGLSADMDDLLTKKGQQDAKDYFKQLMFDIENDNYDKSKRNNSFACPKFVSKANEVAKDKSKKIAVVSCHNNNDLNTIEMIKEFIAKCPYEVSEYNVNDFNFQGGCLGCFSCAVSGHCVYKDGFEDYLRNSIQSADAVIYAFPIINHYSHSSLKNYDDRQFCNGHRMVQQGMPVGYLLSGNYSNEHNLQTIINGRAEVGRTYLCKVVSDEGNVEKDIDILVKNLGFALENKLSRPKNFFGEGGERIFRDLIFEMRGLMQADHKFYKKTGVYDSFPQKHKGRIFQMKCVGLLMKSKKVQQKMKGKMGKFIIAPYEKVLTEIREKKGE